MVYRKGGLPSAPKDLGWLAFKDLVGPLLATYHSAWLIFRRKGDELPTGWANVDKGGVGVLQTLWFPWASPRDRLKGFIHVLNELRRDMLVMFWAKSGSWPFFTHICKYGILKRAGRIEGLYWDRQNERDAEQDDAMLFYSSFRG